MEMFCRWLFTFCGQKNVCDGIPGINSSIALHLWFRSHSMMLSVKFVNIVVMNAGCLSTH